LTQVVGTPAVVVVTPAVVVVTPVLVVAGTPGVVVVVLTPVVVVVGTPVVLVTPVVAVPWRCLGRRSVTLATVWPPTAMHLEVDGQATAASVIGV
jgi:hypothetical protein